MTQTDEELFKNVKRIVIKFGGHAMTDAAACDQIAEQIAELDKKGYEVIVVHGGGPYIKKLLKDADVESEFVQGQRKTDKHAMQYVEMALSGQVNGMLVNALNKCGAQAVGLSGKSAHAAKVRRITEPDLGYVGEVISYDSALVDVLVSNKYLPVISPVSAFDSGESCNVNADIFAGFIAGAMNADLFIMLTDVNGLRKDVNKPESRISSLSLSEAVSTLANLEGGMIPKITACITAVRNSVPCAHIIPGDSERSIFAALDRESDIGTKIWGE